jgi:hypothetical protein
MTLNKKIIILRLVYYVDVICLLIGCLFKIQHWYGAVNLLVIGNFVSLAFIFLAMIAIYLSKRVSFTQKVLWTFLFIPCFLLIMHDFSSQQRPFILLELLSISIIGGFYLRFYRKKIITPIRIEFDFDKKSA